MAEAVRIDVKVLRRQLCAKLLESTKEDKEQRAKQLQQDINYWKRDIKNATDRIATLRRYIREAKPARIWQSDKSIKLQEGLNFLDLLPKDAQLPLGSKELRRIMDLL